MSDTDSATPWPHRTAPRKLNTHAHTHIEIKETKRDTDTHETHPHACTHMTRGVTRRVLVTLLQVGI